MKYKILHIDDDIDFLEAVPHYLGDEFIYISADNLEKGYKKIKENPHLILLDIELDSEVDGIHAISKFRDLDNDIPIVMLTKHNDYQLVVQAMKNGAADYCVKSPDMSELRDIIKKTINFYSQKEELNYLKREIESDKGKIIGESPVMLDLFEKINHAASMNCHVLITGETGTGKELIARAIHNQGKNSKRPFVAVNISGINDDLFASELFGYEKGAFTGALQRKKGLFEIAEDGTLFLDEIGYLSIDSQVKLLRVLEEKVVRRVGGTDDIETPVRILAATNQNLEYLMQKNKFREDLFYRLNVYKIDVPPLRERKQDIPILAEYFIKQLKPDAKIEKEAIDHLLSYNWPGNIRELRNIIEISVLTDDTGVISKKHLQKIIQSSETSPKRIIDLIDEDLFDMEYKLARDKVLSEFKKNYISNCLKKTNGNKSKAAKLCGLSRTGFDKILES